MSVRALDDALSARNLANLNAANVPLKLLYEDFNQPVPKRPCLLTGDDVDKDVVNDAYEGTGVTWRLQGKITATTQGPRKGTTWRKLMMSAKNQPPKYLRFEQVTTNGETKEWLLVDATPGGQACMAGTHAQVGGEAVQYEQLAVAHAAPQPPPPLPTNTYAEARQETSLGVPTEFLTGTSSGATRAGPLPSASNISSINRNLDQAQGGGASAQQAHPTCRLEGVTDLVNDTDMVGYTSQQNGGVAPVLGSSFVFPSYGQGFSNLGTGDVMEASVVKDAHDVTGASSSARSKRRRDESDARETNLDMKALDIRRVMELMKKHPRHRGVPLMRLIKKELEIIPSTACLSVLRGHSGLVYSASYSTDGTRIVSSSQDKTVRVWDATTGACLSVLEDHSDSVISASYSADGTRIVSASRDKTVRVWDATTGACLSVLEGHSSVVCSASYSADGTRIVSASLDNTVRVWDAT
ncbi:WD40 repeat-like protein [Pycnococcus provasolii]